MTASTRTRQPPLLMTPARISLHIVLWFVGVTAVAGGVALVFAPSLGDVAITPPEEYLEGSGFDSYLVPGLMLLVVVAGTQLVAAILLARRHRLALTGAAVAGFGILIWIFIQMIFVPFSVLQAIYFAAGLAELGLVIVLLDVLGLERISKT